MRKSLIVVLVVSLVAVSYTAYAQIDAGSKARALAAALDKNKYKKKEKHNITIETYLDIKHELFLRSPAEYSGVYASEGYKLDLKVASDGSAQGSGFDMINFDGSPSVRFTLRDARVDGALLTGTKAFADGRTEKFEAVFVARTVVEGVNKEKINSRETHYGLGFIQTWDHMTSRAFLEKQD